MTTPRPLRSSWPRPHLPRLAGPPLGWQLIAMLVCTLVAAQLVTLALTVLIPPRPPRQWNIEDVAAALSGQGLSPRLEQARMDGPPDVAGAGWLISESARAALAHRLGLPEDAVVLAFYTQLPVGGVAVPARTRAPLTASASPSLSALIVPPASAQALMNGPSGGFSGGAMPGTGFPGGMNPGGFPGGFPGNGMPGGLPGRGNGPLPGHGMGPGGNGPGGSGPGGMGKGGGAPGNGNGRAGSGTSMGPGGAGTGMGTSRLPMRALPDTAMPSGGPVMGQSTLDQLRTSLGNHETPTVTSDLAAPALAPRLPVESGPLASPHPVSYTHLTLPTKA